MKKLGKYLIFSLMLLNSFILFGMSKANIKEEKLVDYEIYTNEIIRDFTKEIKNEFGLICKGDGGQMPHDVEMIYVGFISYQKTTVEQARELLIKINERLLQIINAHEKIRPFLREYPFPSKRTEVSISFHDKNEYYTDGNVAFAFHTYNLSKDYNLICYCKADPKTKDFIDLHEEYYEEALKIVNGKSL